MRYCDEVLLEAHGEGLSLVELLGHTVRSWAHHHRGSFTEAVADAGLALSAARKAELPPDHFGHVYAVEALMCAQLKLGAADDADETPCCSAGRGHCRRLGSTPSSCTPGTCCAWNAATSKERSPTSSTAVSTRCPGAWAVRPCAPGAPTRRWPASGWGGVRQPALDLALEELALARERGAPTVVARALLTVGIAAGGATAILWLTEADSLLRRSPALMLHAEVPLELAAARRTRGSMTR